MFPTPSVTYIFRRWWSFTEICGMLLLILILCFQFRNVKSRPTIYVLSLKRATDRRAHIQRELFFYPHVVKDAVDGSNLTIAETKLLQSYLDPSSNLRPGEIGCLLSHIMLWKQIVSEGISSAIIFEDDVKVNGSLWRVVRTLTLKQDVDYALLGHCFEDSTSRIVGQIPGYTIRVSERGECTHGYYITLKGCKQLLRSITHDKCTLPIDDCIRNKYQQKVIRAVSIHPPVVTVQRMVSTIDPERMSILDQV